MADSDVILVSSEDERSDTENQQGATKRLKMENKWKGRGLKHSSESNGSEKSEEIPTKRGNCVSNDTVVVLVDDGDEDDVIGILEDVVPPALLTPGKAGSNNSSQTFPKVQPVGDPANDSDDNDIHIVTPANSALVDEARNSLHDYIYYLKRVVGPAERKKLKDKLESDFQKIHFDSVETAKEVKAVIDQSLLRLKASRKESKVLKPDKRLLEYFKTKLTQTNPRGQNKRVNNNTPNDETEEERKAKREEALRIQYELGLKKYSKKIQRYDTKEVDLEDEINSAYLVRSRMVNRFMSVYKGVCHKSGCNFKTGRPIEKKLKLKDITPFPELNEAVEKYINSKPVLFTPDFSDIHDIVTKINNKSLPPLMEKKEIIKTADSLFQTVNELLQSRRRQDFVRCLPLETPQALEEDPADKDPELMRKLQENESLKGSVKEILDKFERKQMVLKIEAREVGDMAESSAPESDDEDEKEDIAAEHFKGEVKGAAADNKQMFTREECSDESDDEEMSFE